MDDPSAGSGTAPGPGHHWSARRGRAAGLNGVSGRMELRIVDQPVGVLDIEDGLAIVASEGEAPAAIICDDEPVLMGLLSGELHPIVAHLQGRLRFRGETALALRILLGLQADSPWSKTPQGS